MSTDNQNEDEQHSHDEERPPRRGWDDYEDRPRGPRRPQRSRRPPPPAVEATDFLIPTGVSAWSMAACYFGIFSCVIPFLGLLMALVALPSGIIALRKRKGTGTYGSITGDIRAVIGIVTSSLTLIGHAVLFVIILTKP